jgi:hypothetical protein
MIKERTNNNTHDEKKIKISKRSAGGAFDRNPPPMETLNPP